MDAIDLPEIFVCVQQNTECHVQAQSYLHVLLTSNSAFCYPNLLCQTFRQTKREMWMRRISP